ncbi:antibiotic ABC transporter permease [Halobaculum halobium]|uniref:Antibiotic ABC transporter permease n=1 Tax=Halobaculum halobium TaxID=3032281 RepID=A0ABD5TBM0_9EURY|nr:antibiotic ABC transporter permease [Halobaculum sp. SYNS20]
MSSRLLNAAPVEDKWLNIAVQEGIKRAPVDLRPLFLVEQRQSFKGSALFAMANRRAADLTGDDLYAEEADSLLDWLLEHSSEDRDPGYAGFCGGHRHAMQLLDEYREAEVPNVIPTSYATKALCRATDGDDEYAAAARSAADFLLEDLRYTELDTGARIVYQPEYDGEFYTVNGGAIGARLFVDLYDRFGDEDHLERASALLDTIATHQTDRGGWTYRVPAEASHLSMDSHHNGFVIESFQRYHEVTGEERYADTLERALSFYRLQLFDPDGAPNFDESSRYPRDIHAATQGIIVFANAGDFAFARRVIDWVLANLYAGQGQFYYQKRRLYTKQFTLMRWCQAWMAYALGEYLTATANASPVDESRAGTAAPVADDDSGVLTSKSPAADGGDPTNRPITDGGDD